MPFYDKRPPKTLSEQQKDYAHQVAKVWSDIRQLEQENLQLAELIATRRRKLGPLHMARELYKNLEATSMAMHKELTLLEAVYQEMKRSDELEPEAMYQEMRRSNDLEPEAAP